MANYSSFGYMPLDVAEQYAQNKRDWSSGNETQKNLATLNNQQIREAYGITQDVPLGEVERYIDALKTDNTKKSLITKITNPSAGNNVKSSAEAVKNFSYNPANDPAYQSYVDAYTRQGQSAAKQTMANLAASNMGRNSSYGAAATAQVQQAYAKQAADMIPQLSQQAYARLMDMYSIDKDLEDTEYNRALTGYQTLADDKTRQLSDEQLRLGNIGAELNNQASQIELQYLEPSLRQQVLSGALSLDEAIFKNQMMNEYGKRQWDAETRALENQAAGKVSGGSGGVSRSSSNSNVNTKNIDNFIKRFNQNMKTYVNEKGNNYYDMAGVEGDILIGGNGQYVFGNAIGGTKAWNDPLLNAIYTDPYLTADEVSYLITSLGLIEPDYMVKKSV
jgi:hypothetical protein